MIRFLILVLLTLIGCSGCYWHLRNPGEVPPQLKVLYLSAEGVDSHFKIQLVNLLRFMQINQAQSPAAAPFTLHVYDYSLSHDNPPVSSTNVAITYTYTLTVNVSILNSKGEVVVPEHNITTTRQITVNVSQIFTINSTSVFQQELQREAINLIYYWLTSDRTRRLLTTASHPTRKTAHAAQLSPASATP